jgi:hypothetical protein
VDSQVSAGRGLEVFGGSLVAVYDGFGPHTEIATRIMIDRGLIGRGSDGKFAIDPGRWYPMRSWIETLCAIEREVGPNIMFNVGKNVPKYARFPPTITDITSLLTSTDVAYHMNHRKDGKLMFDSATGSMIEGIGHYRSRRIIDKNEIVTVINSPYPCEFDRGLLTALANRFEPQAKTVHIEGSCRKIGRNLCRYSTTW